MSNNFKKFTLAAGFVVTLGYLVGCGTRGENTGFKDNATGPVTGLGSSAAAAASGTTGSGLTGGASGTPVVNSAFPVTVATGLTISNMLSVASGGGGTSGASNPPTQLGFGTFGGLKLPVVVQGFGLVTLGSGRVTIMPRNPETPPGTNNVVLAPTTGSASPLTITNPFGLLADGSTIYVTDGAVGATGRVIRYTGIQTTGATIGACQADQLATALNQPVDVVRDGNFLYVAEFGSSGGLGRISRIDISSGAAFPNRTTFITSVNFCTSIAIDNANGHHFLYVVENSGGSSGNANGGIIRVDLNTFTAGNSFLSGGVGSAPNVGVQLILPSAGPPAQTAYNSPFDLAVDSFSNVVFTEGLNAAGAGGLLSPTANPGAIRVIRGGTTPAITSTVVLQNSAAGTAVGLNALRGVSLNNEDSTGTVLSAFFTEGNTTGTTTTMRQVTFRATDAAVFRHIQLDNGKLAPLDTLFDAGDSTLTPIVAPNVKYTVGSFNGGTNGQVLDIR